MIKPAFPSTFSPNTCMHNRAMDSFALGFNNWIHTRANSSVNSDFFKVIK
jgi:hypothetical protein